MCVFWNARAISGKSILLSIRSQHPCTVWADSPKPHSFHAMRTTPGWLSVTFRFAATSSKSGHVRRTERFPRKFCSANWNDLAQTCRDRLMYFWHREFISFQKGILKMQ